MFEEEVGYELTIFSLSVVKTPLFTCSDDFLNLHAGDVDLTGELVHRLVGVFVSERVDVDFHTRGHCEM